LKTSAVGSPAAELATAGVTAAGFLFAPQTGAGGGPEPAPRLPGTNLVMTAQRRRFGAVASRLSENQRRPIAYLE